MIIYTIFVLLGQSVATLLGRLYFEKGGKSKWMATIVQTAGFPILIPFYFFFSSLKISITENNLQTKSKSPSTLTLTLIYVAFGLLLAANCTLYSIGLMYLPVSTYSLLCATQLAFNAFFSFFLNSQKFTPFIVNSLVLLTISAALLIFHSDDKNPVGVSKVKYTIGFLSTIGASAMYGLLLSLTQMAFQRVIKRESVKAILDLIVYPALVGTIATLIGLIASKEWKSLPGEIEGFGLGKSAFVLVLVWTAISWQVFTIGVVGLILEVSSLFSNVISTLSLPIVPIFAVVFFYDKMDALKVIAMILSVWGFVSYVYQLYLDSFKKTINVPLEENFEVSRKERSSQ